MVEQSGHSYWFAGAFWSDRDPQDQTGRFLREGVWENGFEDKLLDEVRQMRPGDRIAIKATTNQKWGLPFEAFGKTKSIMRIKATGTISSNEGDGRRVHVKWDPLPSEQRIWYFYTFQGTLWRPKQKVEAAQRLIAFTFDGEEQDVNWFLENGYAPHPNGAPLADLVHTVADAAQSKVAADDLLPPSEPYSVDDLQTDGVFIARSELEQTLTRWRSKKNLILQGPPGVGKTFVARRLAYALMEDRDPERIGSVQFHQSYAYDDFVRGYRPRSGGGFDLQDGVFYRFCAEAAKDSDPDRPWVFIIDEINRGNVAQILGELLMLIESDKRSSEYAVPLVYRADEHERFHVPPNVYLLGLMNVADRSLALVDYALRRRFAFVTLRPLYDSPVYHDWLRQRSMPEYLISLIVGRMTALNDAIRADSLLGPSYQIGHSYFCPKGSDFTELGRPWYESVIETEIVPLLHEYWIDDQAKVDGSPRSQLLTP